MKGWRRLEIVLLCFVRVCNICVFAQLQLLSIERPTTSSVRRSVHCFSIVCLPSLLVFQWLVKKTDQSVLYSGYQSVRVCLSEYDLAICRLISNYFVYCCWNASKCYCLCSAHEFEWFCLVIFGRGSDVPTHNIIKMSIVITFLPYVSVMALAWLNKCSIVNSRA